MGAINIGAVGAFLREGERLEDKQRKESREDVLNSQHDTKFGNYQEDRAWNNKVNQRKYDDYGVDRQHNIKRRNALANREDTKFGNYQEDRNYTLGQRNLKDKHSAINRNRADADYYRKEALRDLQLWQNSRGRYGNSSLEKTLAKIEGDEFVKIKTHEDGSVSIQTPEGIKSFDNHRQVWDTFSPYLGYNKKTEKQASPWRMTDEGMLYNQQTGKVVQQDEKGNYGQTGVARGAIGSASNVSQYLVNGKNKSHANIKPTLGSKFNQMLVSMPKELQGQIKIFSGYRDKKHQARLFKKAVDKYGSEAKARKHVAPPGKSQHNHGGALDLRYASPEAKKWAHANAKKFGLHFRMGHEPWHIEEIKDGKTPSPAERAQYDGVWKKSRPSALDIETAIDSSKKYNTGETKELESLKRLIEKPKPTGARKTRLDAEQDLALTNGVAKYVDGSGREMSKDGLIAVANKRNMTIGDLIKKLKVKPIFNHQVK